MAISKSGITFVSRSASAQRMRSAAIVAAAGKSDLLVQRSIDRLGHCTSSVEEELMAFEDLVLWAETGVKPPGGFPPWESTGSMI